LNSDKRAPILRPQDGNALIYILIALALIGALTVSLTRQADVGGDTLSQEEIDLLTTEVFTYAASLESTIDQMILTGSDPRDIQYFKPNSVSFDPGVDTHKLFHPDGGGAIDQPMNPKLFRQTAANPPAGWYIGRFINVQWTPTTTWDILFTAFQINRDVCANINKIITGNPTIPTITGGFGFMATYLVDDAFHTNGNADLTSTVCPGCVGYDSLCVSNATAAAFSYYRIIRKL